jgi:hypothetical protein
VSCNPELRGAINALSRGEKNMIPTKTCGANTDSKQDLFNIPLILSDDPCLSLDFQVN